jgi:hypothetical protein
MPLRRSQRVWAGQLATGGGMNPPSDHPAREQPASRLPKSAGFVNRGEALEGTDRFGGSTCARGRPKPVAPGFEPCDPRVMRPNLGPVGLRGERFQRFREIEIGWDRLESGASCPSVPGSLRHLDSAMTAGARAKRQRRGHWGCQIFPSTRSAGSAGGPRARNSSSCSLMTKAETAASKASSDPAARSRRSLGCSGKCSSR